MPTRERIKSNPKSISICIHVQAAHTSWNPSICIGSMSSYSKLTASVTYRTERIATKSDYISLLHRPHRLSKILKFTQKTSQI